MTIRLFLVCVVMVLGAVDANAVPEVTVFAVGSNESFRSELPDLKFAEEDAERFVTAMTTVGLVPQARTTILKGGTVDDFRRVVAEIKKPTGLSVRADNRKLIFYFSGHADESGLHFRDGVISKKELHEQLGFIKANTKVAIIDSCFSGALTIKGVRHVDAFELPRMEFDEPSGSVFLSSASARQYAYESDRLEGSIFTHHLIAGLYGEADGNTDGVVTIDELYHYVYRNTKWQSLNLPTKNSQEPRIVADLKGQGAVIVSFPSQTNSRLALEKAVDGEVTIASEKGIQYFRVEKKSGNEKVLQLPAGRYLVSVRKGETVGRGNIELQPAKIAFLSKGDFNWSTEPEIRREKGMSFKQALGSVGPAKVGIGFGWHTGYGEESETGPSFDLSWSRSLITRGRVSGDALAVLNYHQNALEDGPLGGRLVTHSTLLMGGIGASWKMSSIWRMGGFWGMGQSYHDQRYYYSDTSDSEKYGGGGAPAMFWGMNFIYHGLKKVDLGVTARWERIEAHQISNTAQVNGMTLALSVLY